MQTLVALSAAFVVVLLGSLLNAPTAPAEVVPEPPQPVAVVAPPPSMPAAPADNAPSGG